MEDYSTAWEWPFKSDLSPSVLKDLPETVVYHSYVYVGLSKITSNPGAWS